MNIKTIISNPPRPFDRKLPWFIGAMIVVILGSLFFLEHSIRENRRQFSINIMHAQLENAIKREQERLGDLARDYGFWTEAIENMVVRADHNWADHNIGSYIQDNSHIDVSLLISANNQGLLRYENSKEILPATIKISDSLNALIEQARTIDPEKGGIRGVSGLINLDGRILLAGAFSLRPDLPTKTPEARYKNTVLVLARRLDEAMLMQWQSELLLRNIQFKPQPTTVSTLNSDEILLGSSPETRGIVTFTPQFSPKTRLEQILPMGFIALGCTCLLGLFILWRVQRLLKMYQHSNTALVAENQQRKEAENALRHLQEDLEQQIQDRTRALQEKEQYLRSIIHNSGEGIMVLNDNSQILSINPSGAALLTTMEPEYLHGQSFTQFIESPTTSIAEGTAAHQSAKIHHWIREFNRPQRFMLKSTVSQTFPAELTLSPMQTEQGYQYIGIIRDISERESLINQIRENQTQLQNILDSAGEGYLRLSQSGRILEANEMMCTMMGWIRDIILGQPFLDVIAPQDRPSAETHLNDRHKNWQHHYEQVFHTPTGIRTVIINATSNFDSQGILTGSFAFISDITSIKENEKALQQAKEQAETASRAKSDFLSSMSHELRTPMNAILGFAQLLEHSRRDPLNERQRQQVQQINQAGKHLLSLINQVLDLAKIEAGQLHIRPEALSVSSIVKDCLMLLETQVQDHQLRVTNAIGPETPMVYADEMRLTQILINLLNNAIKYNRPNGEIEISSECTPDMLRVSIRDTGPGLSAEQQALLFEPFQRLGYENSTIEGTGIGLNISRQIIEAMGGRIGVESQEHQGSTFWFTLPLAMQNAQNPET